MRDEVKRTYVCFHARRGARSFHARRGEARTFVFMRDEVKHTFVFMRDDVRLFSCETR